MPTSSAPTPARNRGSRSCRVHSWLDRSRSDDLILISPILLFLAPQVPKKFCCGGTERVAKLRSRRSTGVIVCDDCCTECSKADSFRKSFAVACPNENERYDAQVVSLCTLSYLWGSCRNALFAAFRSPTQRTAHRQKTGCN
jgi:hypothetical protein